jgi:hypothetical protein
MSWFKRDAPPLMDIEARLQALLPNYDEDHLGNAAAAEREALQAIRNNEFDRAWQLLHQQKAHYARHAARAEFTPKQVLALDASVSEHLANVLRLEGHHHEALIHVIYWVACSPRRTKNEEAKLPAYFKRAKLPGVTLPELERFIAELQPLPDFRVIQGKVEGWHAQADGT